MAYDTNLVRKLNDDLDIASGSCRARNQIIKIWRVFGDLEYAINNVKYKTINREMMQEVIKKYRDLISQNV